MTHILYRHAIRRERSRRRVRQARGQTHRDGDVTANGVTGQGAAGGGATGGLSASAHGSLAPHVERPARDARTGWQAARASGTRLLVLALACLVAAHGRASLADEPTPAEFSRDVAPLLEKYCASCHRDSESHDATPFSFESAADVAKQVAADRNFFVSMSRQLTKLKMPPADHPQPTDEERRRLIGWLDKDLLQLDCSARQDPGRVTARRLNRVEYARTVRDLLYLDDFQLAEDFPPDDSAYGFDNNGDVLTLSPILLEKYLAAAESALQLAAKTPRAAAKLREPVGELKESFWNRQEYPRLMVAAFLPRAFRRPVPPDEIDRYMTFVRLSLAQDGEQSERAARLAMRAALMSPHFLFRIEGQPDEEEGIRPLNEFELASRLSYFLWSSMPDPELFELAAAGRLRDNLAEQVRRMLHDPKARALADNFAMQWLGLRSLKSVTPDPLAFPQFNDELRNAMIEETIRLFAGVVAEDRNILDLLNADYTWVNETLASHYGIAGVTGSEFQRVAVDPRQRGGLLTHAGILTVTSRPNRTAPVLRGKWILENILNAPPPPPPPDVPELKEAEAGSTASIRELLERHRADASCAVCHKGLDPLGLALENYDPVGRWRDTDAGAPIDASGELPDGRRFDGPHELRTLLLSRADDFRRCLAEKLLTYALGRGIDFSDKCAIDAICRETAAGADRFSSLILAIVESDPFQLRRGNQGPGTRDRGPGTGAGGVEDRR